MRQEKFVTVHGFKARPGATHSRILRVCIRRLFAKTPDYTCHHRSGLGVERFEVVFLVPSFNFADFHVVTVTGTGTGFVTSTQGKDD